MSEPDPPVSDENASVERSWIVAQLGAREHYAVPRALARIGCLQHFYTDAWCRWGRTLLRQGPPLLRGLSNRYHGEVPSSQVTSYTGRAVANVLWRRVLEVIGMQSGLFEHHAKVGRWFALQIAGRLRRQSLDPEQHAFFGFATGSLEVLRHLRGRGVPTILDQMSPGPVEREIVAKEAERWHGWGAKQVPGEQTVLERRVAAEWEAASLVLVNSQWSRRGLLAEGVPDEKIIVVPCAYEPSEELDPPPPSRAGPLRVLWLGTVGLRKGIQYLIEAARRLDGSDIEFIVAGPIGITDHARRQAPATMQFLGPVARDRATDLYEDADVFVLPTLSEGFGLTQLEAMAHGRPVVTTPRCGDVVTDGHDGFLVPPRSAEALAEALRTLDTDRDRLRHMARAARKTIRSYSLDAYARRLRRAVQRAAIDS